MSAVQGLLLFAAALLCLSLGIARMPVTDRDEARFAQASKQMAASGDWIDIRLQDAPRYKKPVGIYWLQAGLTTAIGAAGSSNIAQYRMVSVIAAALCILALAWAGAPLVGAMPALAAGVMMASTIVLGAEARIAKTDAALLLATILAMGALARAAMGAVQGWQVPAVFWTAIAAGILIKGPLILAPVTCAALWTSLSRRSAAWLRSLKPLPGLAWCAVLAAPWFIAITFVAGEAFWAESLGRDFAAKIEGPQESHGAPPGSYLLALWVTGWPWAALAPFAAWALWRDWRSPEVGFLLGWLIPFWLVLEIVPTKLLHYTMPVYPALMLLIALAVSRVGLPRGWGLVAAVALWLAGGAVLTGATFALPYTLGDGGAWLAGSAALLSLGIGAAGIWAVRTAAPGQRRFTAGFAAIAVSSVAMIWTVVALAMPAAKDVLISQRLAALSACHEGQIIIGGYGEPSAAFLMGTDIVLTSPEGARAALAATPGALAWIDSPGTTGGIRVAGTNYSNGRPVSLQLFLYPDRPAEEAPCS
ncbi:MAG: glycosyltransferase family 39 protein [Pseudomonadota bacterium]